MRGFQVERLFTTAYLQVLAHLTGVETPFLDSCMILGSKFIDEAFTWTAEFLEFDTQWHEQLRHH